MDLDRSVCDRARRSRDARFDGRFFIGVTTTRIYCRPICPARAPKDEPIRYFPTAAAAEAEGFRPCLRCRPEASPGTPAWIGNGVVSRALRLIAEGALDEQSVEQLADRVGVTGPCAGCSCSISVQSRSTWRSRAACTSRRSCSTKRGSRCATWRSPRTGPFCSGVMRRRMASRRNDRQSRRGRPGANGCRIDWRINGRSS